MNRGSSKLDAGPEIDPGQLGVVVQHLLEMGDQPLVVDRVPGESAAELVVDAAVGHFAQGPSQHRRALLRPGLAVSAEQELEDRLLGEFRCVAESPVDRVV